MRAPFPYFGGKSRIAPFVWERFGSVRNYVEPFFGSGAVLLSRPVPFTGSETVNDANGFLVNFWRSVKLSPDETAEHAAYPVSELDILARHDALLNVGQSMRDSLRLDPEWHDPKFAGWWVYGICNWIGSGWCESACDKIPHLGDAGQGVTKRLPHLGNAGKGFDMAEGLREWFSELSARFARVRVTCGDWSRVTGESVTVKHGTTAVFLDPPYDVGSDVDYGQDVKGLSSQVWEWAQANGDNPELRIALCGYEGEHETPKGWTCESWNQRKGYQKADDKGNHTGRLERVWFSPYCQQVGLFAEVS